MMRVCNERLPRQKAFAWTKRRPLTWLQQAMRKAKEGVVKDVSVPYGRALAALVCRDEGRHLGGVRDADVGALCDGDTALAVTLTRHLRDVGHG